MSGISAGNAQPPARWTLRTWSGQAARHPQRPCHSAAFQRVYLLLKPADDVSCVSRGPGRPSLVSELGLSLLHKRGHPFLPVFLVGEAEQRGEVPAPAAPDPPPYAPGGRGWEEVLQGAPLGTGAGPDSLSEQGWPGGGVSVPARQGMATQAPCAKNRLSARAPHPPGQHLGSVGP